MALESTNGQINQNSKVSGFKIKYLEMAYLNTMMAGYIMDHG